MMVCGRNEQAEIPLQVKPFGWPLDKTQMIQWTSVESKWLGAFFHSRRLSSSYNCLQHVDEFCVHLGNYERDTRMDVTIC